MGRSEPAGEEEGDELEEGRDWESVDGDVVLLLGFLECRDENGRAIGRMAARLRREEQTRGKQENETLRNMAQEKRMRDANSNDKQ